MKKPEFMEKEELIQRFNTRYSSSSKRKFLEGIANKNRNLVNKFILGKEKNPYYTPNDVSPITRNDNEYYALINWIIPQYRYKYKEVSWEDYCEDKNVWRSGVIPVVKIDGFNYWLLGSFHDYENTNNPILSDFGGACEEKDKGRCTAYSCARREMLEETKNLLPGLVHAAISRGDVAILKGENLDFKESIYFIFVELEYEDVKDISEQFKNKEWPKENFGNLGFYSQKDIKSGKYRTSKNLTDFLDYLGKV